MAEIRDDSGLQVFPTGTTGNGPESRESQVNPGASEPVRTPPESPQEGPTDQERPGNWPAGVALDRLVATRVLGRCVHDWDIRAIELDEWDAHCRLCGEDRGGTYGMLGPVSGLALPYSTDVAAAWKVVEAMQRRGWVVEIYLDCFSDGEPAGVEVALWHDVRDLTNRPRIFGDTAPLAICRAALHALGSEEAAHG